MAEQCELGVIRGVRFGLNKEGSRPVACLQVTVELLEREVEIGRLGDGINEWLVAWDVDDMHDVVGRTCVVMCKTEPGQPPSYTWRSVRPARK